MTIRLSILDQSIVGENQTYVEALNNTVLLAQEAEKLGYHRFWVAEHHNSKDRAGSAPEVLMGYLAAKTNTIRIASGGVMLQHYSPYKVAEQFSVLASLAPGRIDIGVGKAPGGFQASTAALQEDKVNHQKSFNEKLASLVNFTYNSFNIHSPYKDLEVLPIPTKKPNIYLLGSSESSAITAARLGISFVFAYFLNGDEETLKKAKEAFDANLKENKHATFQLASIVYVADTVEQAEKHIKSRETIKIVLESGKSVNVSSQEQAEVYLKNVNESCKVIRQKRGIIAGTGAEVRKEIERLSKICSLQDFIISTPIINLEEKIHSYKLLMKAFKDLNVFEEISN